MTTSTPAGPEIYAAMNTERSVKHAVIETLLDPPLSARADIIRHNALVLEDHLEHDLAAAATTTFVIAVQARALFAEIFPALAHRSNGDESSALATILDLIDTFDATRGIEDE